MESNYRSFIGNTYRFITSTSSFTALNGLMYQEISISGLPATSGATLNRMRSVGIETWEDLLNYFPSRYEDYSLISSIGRLQAGEMVTIKGTLKDIKQIYTRGGLRMQKVKLEDATGTIELTWYNQPYLVTAFRKAVFLSVSGEVVPFMNTVSLRPEQYEVIEKLDSPTIHTGRLVPVYPEKHGLTSRLIRTKLFSVMNIYFANSGKIVEEFLPTSSVSDFMEETEAYRQVHFPDSLPMIEKARRRLSFDELFFIQLASAKVRSEWRKTKTGTPLDLFSKKAKLESLISSLKFSLTGAQKRTLNEILTDMSSETPMNRFLQGEVGSGKTIVAALACYVAYLNGYQSVFMAPTEILAKQHFETIQKVFAKTPLKVALQTGSIKDLKTKKTEGPKNFDIIVGTHALLTKGVNLEKVALIVIDEQHRFGVAQRAALKEKGIHPHLLTMTATPIPRTVVLTLHGELDLSILDEMPKGRKDIKTYLVPGAKKASGYRWVSKQIKKEGVQVFVICPLIEESEVETMKSVKAATKEYEYLKKDIFPDLRVGLLHGKMKSSEKNEVMKQFKEKKYDILVSTSVVEVGIDIPNATIMIIEGADRFGLAQLHQLRGRVGRGEKQSYCFLYTDVADSRLQKKLSYFASHSSGLELAEYDLKMRGPGDIYGVNQHGYADLNIASLSDRDMIYRAKKTVNEIVKETNFDFSQYPLLKIRLENLNRQMIARD